MFQDIKEIPLIQALLSRSFQPLKQAYLTRAGWREMLNNATTQGLPSLAASMGAHGFRPLWKTTKLPEVSLGGVVGNYVKRNPYKNPTIEYWKNGTRFVNDESLASKRAKAASFLNFYKK